MSTQPQDSDTSEHLTADVFQALLGLMKDVLQLGEYKLGQSSGEYRFYKSTVMDATWKSTRKLMRKWQAAGLVRPCECGHNMRNGWASCPHCGGCGYRLVGDGGNHAE